MAEVKVGIKTTYDNRGTKQARDELGRFVKKGTTEGDKLKSSFGGLGETISGSLGGLVTGAAIGLAAKEVADFAVETFKLAEQNRVVTSSFTNLSGSANIAKINLQAMGRATRGLISETEQMQIASQLMGMNIVQTDEQLEQVVGVSRRLGKEFRGLGAREAAEEFAIMIANMSVARLDSFGLSSGEVRERIIELMATTEGMTREQAFFQATMEEGERLLQRLGPEINTTSDEVARLGAEWANFQVFLGKTVEESGVVTNFFKTLTDDLIVFRNLLGDETPEARIASLNVELEREGERLEMLRGRGDSFFGIFASGADKAAENISNLQAELARLTNAQEFATKAGRNEQERLQAAIASEEKVAENVAKRAESAKRLAEVQQEFSRDAINLQEQTDDQLLDSQEKFDGDSEKNEADHAKRLSDIRKQSAKDQVRSAAKLQKDLTKVDTNLKKNLVKQQVDEDKAISKAQQSAAKDEKTSRRQKQIDAAGDERLFQFELRRLAADGNGIAIQEALERRSIEQEIASEKAEFEKETERDKKDDQIASIREEGAERRAQLQQQATERKADLQERNEEEAAARTERIAEQLAEESEAFAQRKADLGDFFTERNDEIREGEQEGLAEIAEALTQANDLTNTQLDSMVTLAKEFGPKFGEAFADGMTKAIGENLKIEGAIASAADIGAGAGPLPLAEGGETTGGRNGITRFQEGGFVERSGIAFVDAGDRVIPADQAGGGGLTINILSPVFGVDDLDAKLNMWGQQIIDATAGALN